MRIEKKRNNFLQRLQFFLKSKIGLKESKAQFMQNLCICCNGLMIGLILNFGTILTYQRSYFTEKYATLVLHLENFLK